MADCTFTISTLDSTSEPVAAVVALVRRDTLVMHARTNTVDGLASFTADDATQYLVSATAIDFIADTHVITPTQDAQYVVTCVPNAAPTSSSPDYCCVYGKLVSPRGAPYRALRMRVAVAAGSVVTPNGDIVFNDDTFAPARDGRVEIMMLRGRQYLITLTGTDEIAGVETFTITVPDLPNARLGDLLFPYATRADIDPNGRITLHLSDGRALTRSVDIRAYTRIESAHTLSDIDGVAYLIGDANVQLYSRDVGFTANGFWSVERAAVATRRLV